ncbi:retrotransposon ORF1 [Tanacetum coccineum]
MERVKEEEEAVKRIKGETLKEKDDPGAFIFPIRLEGQVNENALVDTGSNINSMPYMIYEQLGREEMNKVDRGITMINHTQAKVMGILINVLCQVGVTTLIAKFLILDTPIDHDAQIVIGRRFLRTIGGIVNTQERLFSTFDGFCHQTFHAARSEVMRNVESDSDDEEDYQNQRNKFGAPIYGLKPAPYLNCNDPDERLLSIQTTMRGYDHEADSSQTKRYNTKLAQLLLRHIYSPCIVNWDILNKKGYDGEIDEMLKIRVREAGTDEEIFTSVAWIRAFNINEPIYAKLCHEFYSTYEFDEFARRLRLYQAAELDKEGFDVYFQGGLRNIENFNAREYWASISNDENLSLSRSRTFTIWKPILRVIHKMITYSICQRTTGYDKIQENDLWLLSMFDARHQNGYENVAWVIAKWMKKKGAGTQKESQIRCGQFIYKLARKSRVLTNEVLRSLSALTYYRDLDTTTLRELIDSEDRLIPEDPQPGVPREAIERMEYRQSYHWDRYVGVFEHMDGVYSVPLQRAYNPPGYAQPQYDQYYQQYPPPPQYPPQQQ